MTEPPSVDSGDARAIRKYTDAFGGSHAVYSPGKQPKWRYALTTLVMRSGLYYFQVGRWHLTLWDLMACRPCLPEIAREKDGQP